MHPTSARPSRACPRRRHAWRRCSDRSDARVGRGATGRRRAPGAAPHRRLPHHQPPHPPGDLDRGLLPLPPRGAHPRRLASQALLRPAGLRPALRPQPLLGPHRRGQAVVAPPARRAPLVPRRRPDGRTQRHRGRGRPLPPGHHRVRRPVELVRGLRRHPPARARPPLRRSLRQGRTGGRRCRGWPRTCSARILFEGGVLTAARAASAFEGPPGIALGALAGCMVGEGSSGVQTVNALVEHAEPVRPRGRARG